MPHRRILGWLTVAVVLAASSGRIQAAQCADWQPGFNLPGVNGTVRALTVLDDGSGPALFVGGDFTSAGPHSATRIARWSTAGWSTLGSGTNDRVSTMAAFDDGGGPALYVGGFFTTAGGVPASRIAKWNGSSWSPLGLGADDRVTALAVYDDGGGPALYAGGFFSTMGGLNTGGMARWNGSSWSAVGSGMGLVTALTVFDDGGGPALYAGGLFPGSVSKWNGISWSQVGGGTNGFVFDFVVHDDGSGSALYAAGSFTTAGGITANRVARWNGSAWNALGSGMNSDVNALCVYDAGTGPVLYAGGLFTTAGGSAANQIARWNGTTWSTIGFGATATPNNVNALAVFDTGSGPALIAAGSIGITGGVRVGGLAQWNGATWSGVGSGNGLGAPIYALATFNDGSGRALYAGESAPGYPVTTEQVTRWNGVSWSDVGTGFDSPPHDAEIRALAELDDGTGPALFAGGRFASAGGHPANNVAKWNGNAWFQLVGGTDGEIVTLTAFDDGSGPKVYVGGIFTSAGGVPASNIAAWNGSAWTAVGGGTNYWVESLAVFDDGGGPVLVAGGGFTVAGGVPANGIARWNGSTWAPLGNGIGTYGAVFAMTVFDEGGGPELYAAGVFRTMNGAGGDGISKWNGATWSPLGSGTSESIRALAVWDDGGGPAVFAAGTFNSIGGIQARNIAKWRNPAWSPLVAGPDSNGGFALGVLALTVFDDGAGEGPDLYVAGDFANVGTVPSVNIAEWRGCDPAVPFCFGDGTSGACPCANSGAVRHGCDNSSGTGGALLTASGTRHPDSVVLTSSGERPTALSIFLQGDASVGPLAFGDGLRCAGGALKRLYVKSAIGGSTSAPAPGDPAITTRSAALGDPIASGTTRYYQTYYRDPSSSFCPDPPGKTWNVSSGLSILW